MPPRFRWSLRSIVGRVPSPIERLFQSFVDSPSNAGAAEPCQGFVSEEATALRGAMDVFEAWSNRFLSVCDVHLRARVGGTQAERAAESLSTNHWLMPMLFSEVERNQTAYSRETERALRSVKTAKAAVSPFLGPNSLSDGSSQPFDKAVEALRAACERFCAALTADIERAY
jgi:hypothetical protein